MNPIESSDFTAAHLLSLRNVPDSLKIITERLNVKQMGPADHIRTKHEVKAFIESAGNAMEAEAIITRARERRMSQETRTISISETKQQGQGIRQ